MRDVEPEPESEQEQRDRRKGRTGQQGQNSRLAPQREPVIGDHTRSDEHQSDGNLDQHREQDLQDSAEVVVEYDDGRHREGQQPQCQDAHQRGDERPDPGPDVGHWRQGVGQLGRLREAVRARGRTPQRHRQRDDQSDRQGRRVGLGGVLELRGEGLPQGARCERREVVQRLRYRLRRDHQAEDADHGDRRRERRDEQPECRPGRRQARALVALHVDDPADESHEPDPGHPGPTSRQAANGTLGEAIVQVRHRPRNRASLIPRASVALCARSADGRPPPRHATADAAPTAPAPSTIRYLPTHTARSVAPDA